MAELVAEGNGPLLDPDCRDGKHGSCIGSPCECTSGPVGAHCGQAFASCAHATVAEHQAATCSACGATLNRDDSCSRSCAGVGDGI